MSERRVLFIVEGSRAEPRFLRKMFETLFDTRIDNIVWYNTAIYDLLERMFPEDSENDFLDVLSVLRETVSDEQRPILEREYSDVYLIFDMDPHHQKYSANRKLLDRALDFFDDPTDNGKLYLNYPMLESYRHIKEHGDREFIGRTIGIDSGTLRKYKQIVDGECHPDFRQLTKYTKDTFCEIICLNLAKTNWILNDDMSIPTVDGFLTWTGIDILRKQDELIESENRVRDFRTSKLHF